MQAVKNESDPMLHTWHGLREARAETECTRSWVHVGLSNYCRRTISHNGTLDSDLRDPSWNPMSSFDTSEQLSSYMALVLRTAYQNLLVTSQPVSLVSRGQLKETRVRVQATHWSPMNWIRGATVRAATSYDV